LFLLLSFHFKPTEKSQECPASLLVLCCLARLSLHFCWVFLSYLGAGGRSHACFLPNTSSRTSWEQGCSPYEHTSNGHNWKPRTERKHLQPHTESSSTSDSPHGCSPGQGSVQDHSALGNGSSFPFHLSAAGCPHVSCVLLLGQLSAASLHEVTCCYLTRSRLCLGRSTAR
jgi:hypothetical protein